MFSQIRLPRPAIPRHGPFATIKNGCHGSVRILFCPLEGLSVQASAIPCLDSVGLLQLDITGKAPNTRFTDLEHAFCGLV